MNHGLFYSRRNYYNSENYFILNTIEVNSLGMATENWVPMSGFNLNISSVYSQLLYCIVITLKFKSFRCWNIIFNFINFKQDSFWILLLREFFRGKALLHLFYHVISVLRIKLTAVGRATKKCGSWLRESYMFFNELSFFGLWSAWLLWLWQS